MIWLQYEEHPGDASSKKEVLLKRHIFHSLEASALQYGILHILEAADPVY